MQLPSLRLPTLNTGDWFEDFPARRVLLYSVYTLVLFLIFLVLNFPYRVLVDRILSDVDLSPMQVDVRGANLVFSKGLELRGLTLRRPDWNRLPILEIPRSYLWPGLGGLMRGEISKAKFRGELYGGRVKARWVAGGDLQRSTLQVKDVQLARYPPLSDLFDEGQIFGLLSGYVEIESTGGDVASGRANGEIYLDRLGSESLVYQGLKVLDLYFEETKARFAVQNGRIEIEEISSTGPDILLAGSGQIGLREPIESSVLDLKLTIEPAPDAPPEVKGLLALLPRKRGAKPDAPISISGTLGAPRTR